MKDASRNWYSTLPVKLENVADAPVSYYISLPVKLKHVADAPVNVSL